MKQNKYLIVAILVYGLLGKAETIIANLYDLNDQTKKIFEMKTVQATENNLVKSEVEYRDLKGSIQIKEKATMQGYQLIAYNIDQKQTNQKAEVNIKDGFVYFFLEEDGGKTKKTEKEKLKENTIAPITMFNFVKENWTKLSNGEKLDVRLIVWFRMETVGFELFKVGEEVINGQPALHVRLKPSSFLIAALVKPVDIWYAKSNQHILQMKGRVIPKILSDGKYKDFDSYVSYQFLND